LALVARLRVFSTARDLRFELFRAFDAFDARRICFRAVFGYADSIIRAAETGPMEILPESARHVDSLLRGRPSPGVPTHFARARLADAGGPRRPTATRVGERDATNRARDRDASGARVEGAGSDSRRAGEGARANDAGGTGRGGSIPSARASR